MKNKQIPVFFIAILSYFLHHVFFRLDETKVLRTRSGNLKGFVSKSREGRHFYQFLGIPYAKPPVGELRFEPPQKAEKWEGVLDATNYGKECPQLSHVFQLPDGDENCLFLNVHTPTLPSAEQKKLLPVMVFFHGGFYMYGGGFFYRADYLMDESVIVVIVHYRLNSFGFLNTGDGVVAGNMGLKDQVMSLKWVQENILYFGGDPNSVTIFGQSAGGASVHLHVISPMSKGLFHRAISESGTALSPWSIRSNPGAQSALLASKVGCPRNNTIDMVVCLKRVSMEKIMFAHREIMEFILDPDSLLRDTTMVFVPTVESGEISPSTFLPAHPREMLEAGFFNKVPWMAGANAQDGGLLSLASSRTESAKRLLYNNVTEVFPRILFMHSNENVTRLQEYYLEKTLDIEDFNSFNKFTDMFTDRYYLNGIHDAARLQSLCAPVYLYIYNYKGAFRAHNPIVDLTSVHLPQLDALIYALKTIWKEYILGHEAPFYGVGHVDELAMLFRLRFVSNVRQNHEDYEMSKSMVKLWASFAHNEKTLEFRNVTWNPINPNAEKLQYLNLSLVPSVFDDPFTERYELWKTINASPNL